MYAAKASVVAKEQHVHLRLLAWLDIRERCCGPHPHFSPTPTPASLAETRTRKHRRRAPQTAATIFICRYRPLLTLVVRASHVTTVVYSWYLIAKTKTKPKHKPITTNTNKNNKHQRSSGMNIYIHTYIYIYNTEIANANANGNVKHGAHCVTLQSPIPMPILRSAARSDEITQAGGSGSGR